MLTCPSCEAENEEGASVCSECGLAFLVHLEEEGDEAEPEEAPALIDLESVHGYTAGFLQLNDIAAAASEGRLDSEQRTTLLQELKSYLESERARFAAFPPMSDNEPYTEAIDCLLRGLDVLCRLVDQALGAHDDMNAADWTNLLEQGLDAEADIKRGTELLIQAEALLS